MPCSEYSQLLSEAFGVHVESDNSSIHPQHFCALCFQRGKRMSEAKRTGTPYNSNNLLIHWTPHSSDSGSCAVCDRFDQQGKGGRPRKEPTTQGRPGPLSSHALRTAVKALGVRSYNSGSQLHPSRCQIPAAISPSDVQCPVCDNILETPIQLSCGKIVCGGCIVVQSHTCPGCKGEHANTPESLRAPPEVMLKVIGNLPVRCERPNCGAYVAL